MSPLHASIEMNMIEEKLGFPDPINYFLRLLLILLKHKYIETWETVLVIKLVLLKFIAI